MSFVYPKITEQSKAFSEFIKRVLSENDDIVVEYTRTGVRFVEETDTRYRRQLASCYWKDNEPRYFPKSESRFVPTEAEKKAIAAELPAIAAQLPKPEVIRRSSDPNNPYGKPPLPEEFEAVRRKSLAPGKSYLWSEFHSQGSKDIEFIEARFEKTEGKKYFRKIAWVNGDWCVDYEPDQRPLFGLETLKTDTVAVWIFEGSKACAAARDMSEDHPWRHFIHGAGDAFLATGGALATAAIDLSPINKPDLTIYLVADHDNNGREAMSAVARNLRNAGRVWRFDFDDRFSPAWDIADPLPKAFFDGERYVGPGIQDFKRIGCWMTRQSGSVTLGNGHTRPVYCLSTQAANELAWIASEDRFYFMDALSAPMDDKALDGLFRGQGSGKLSEAVLETDGAKYHAIDYLPGEKRFVVKDGKRILNVYQGTRIAPKAGDATPWLNFIERLVPNAEEAKEVLRWIATLVGKPERKLTYALLMASEMHGVGKTLLGEQILMPLVGLHNASAPTAQIIEDKFTGWLARRKLIVINEIYEGNNWRLANKLKSLITDVCVMERRMGVDVVQLMNSAAFFASSNSIQPVALEDSDRRWLIPALTNEFWPGEKAAEFVSWLEGDGLGIILHWARNQPSNFYVKTGDRAPDTIRKSEMIFDSKSEEEKKIEALFKNMKEDDIFMSNVICQQLKAQNSKATWLKDGKVKAMALKEGLISLGDNHLKAESNKGRLYLSGYGVGYALTKKPPNGAWAEMVSKAKAIEGKNGEVKKSEEAKRLEKTLFNPFNVDKSY